jgi:hypothetical protein
MMTPEQLAKLLDKLVDRVRPAEVASMERAALYVQGEIQRTVRATFPSGRTGELWRSFRPEFFSSTSGSVWGARVVSRLVYAGILDRGGTIYPRVAKALAVPVGQGKFLPVGTYARDVPGLRLISGKERRGKPPILVRDHGTEGRRGQRTELMFVLKKSVTVTPRRYLGVAWARSQRGVAKIIGDDYVGAMVREVTNG